jgi:5-(hydroxymethyl)furfural/furfural oxidase
MRSGIGPREHLESHGIEVARDMPGVGANLQNHPCIFLTVYLPQASAQPPDNISLLQNWLRFSSNQPGCAPADMHLMVFNKLDWHQLGRQVGAVALSVLKSYSLGCVELAAADPEVPPRVQFNLFGDGRDRERLVSGVRFTLELLMDPAVRSVRHEMFLPNHRIIAALGRRTAWNAFKARLVAWMLDRAPLRRRLLAEALLDPEKLLGDEETLRNFVRQYTRLQYHVCGTCRMGRADDAGAVVDGSGQVHGIQRLRVVDASIFPTIPRGYIHFIVLMTAEKIADDIKSDWRKIHDRATQPQYAARQTP